jgi:ribosome-associated toxin RatA of RatAB toxin-antitoxin module
MLEPHGGWQRAGPGTAPHPRASITLPFLALMLSFVRPVGAAGQIDLQVDRDTDLLRVRATVAAAAPAELCYSVIADFDHLADFIPGLVSSRIVSEPGKPLELRQVGETTLGLSRYTIDVTLALMTDPPRRINFTRVAGNLLVMQGSWQVEGDGDGCRIDYRTDMQPEFWVPPLIGALLVRHQVALQLHGLKAEIDRRAAIQLP